MTRGSFIGVQVPLIVGAAVAGYLGVGALVGRRESDPVTTVAELLLCGLLVAFVFRGFRWSARMRSDR